MSQAYAFGQDVFVASSFGLDQTTLGPQFRARSIIESERYKLLDRKQSYYSCTQHDWKQFDFEGRPIPAGNPLLGQPNLSGEPSPWYVPLRLRRPSAPYRLARVIVDSFTNLVFGYQRWPSIGCPGDQTTEEFVRALADAAGLRTLMIRARTIGGMVGTVGLSWRFVKGRPVVQAHNAKHLYVHEWEDRERLIPRHVMEIYKFPRDEWDENKKRFVRNWYWFRRDWTPVADVAFHEQLFTPSLDPQWVVDEANTYSHGDGFTHFVWIQNLPSEHSEEIDGSTDYEGLYETFDALDILHSTLVRGTTLNLDPTLILKLDPDIVARTGVSKGSDNALLVGQTGDAHYMELQGTSVQVGTQLFTKMRESALEVAQCVVPDPNQIGAAGTSSVALKVIYAPMLGKADILREQYERGIRELLVQMIRSARRALELVTVVQDEQGNEVERSFYLDLPPRAVEVPERDETTGEPTGETRTEYEEQRPGKSDVLVFDWGDYFTPTAQDQQQTATTLTQLVSGSLLSQESGADLAARIVRIDPRADWERIQREKKEKEAAQAQMFGDTGQGMGGMGGRVSSQDELPPDALPRSNWSRVLDRGADLKQVGMMRVNELRERMGLPPLEGADGDMTVAEFLSMAKASERIAVEREKAAIEDERRRNAARETEASDATARPRG